MIAAMARFPSQIIYFHALRNAPWQDAKKHAFHGSSLCCSETTLPSDRRLTHGTVLSGTVRTSRRKRSEDSSGGGTDDKRATTMQLNVKSVQLIEMGGQSGSASASVIRWEWVNFRLLVALGTHGGLKEENQVGVQ